jgi:hypothetical protein
VGSLRADVPQIQQLKVESLYVATPLTDGSLPACGDKFEYPRGDFVADPSSQACIASLLDSGVVLLSFDVQARADFDAILQDSDKHGPRLRAVSSVRYSSSGQLVFGNFSVVGDPKSYVYSPGTAVAVAAEPRSDCAESINADWLREWSCDPAAPW